MPDSTQVSHCIFCKIVRGEIPSARVLETDHALVFLDINPLNPGHTLVVPRRTTPTWESCPKRSPPTPARCSPGSAVYQGSHGAEGINVVINNGAVAGQTIHHCHWHIIPRFDHDAIHWPWPQGKYVATR